MFFSFNFIIFTSNYKIKIRFKNKIMKFTWNILSGTTICWNFISLRGEMRFFQHSKHTQPRFQYWIMIKKFHNGVSIGLFRHLPRVENTLTRLRLVIVFFQSPRCACRNRPISTPLWNYQNQVAFPPKLLNFGPTTIFQNPKRGSSSN